MARLDEITMHRENRGEEADDLVLLDEIERWRSEQDQASAMLAAVQAACLEAHRALEAHTTAVREHDQRLRRHEQVVQERQWSGATARDDGLVAEHQTLKAEHALIRREHEEFKKRHWAVMAEIRELCRTALAGAVVTEV